MDKPTPPRKPEPHECCGTGCIPCVMDIYEEELYEYEKALSLLREFSTVPVAMPTAALAVPPANSALDPV